MNKPVAFLAYLIAAHSYGQCTFSKQETDPFTGSRIVSTKLEKIKATAPGHAVYVSASASVRDSTSRVTVLTIALMPSPAGCVTSDSRAIFLFEDGTTESIQHGGSVKCSDPTHFLIVPEGSRILTEQAAKMRLTTTRGSVDVTLGNNDIQRHLACTNL